MHALFDSSEEAPTLPGLGILSGSIRRVPPELPPGVKVPHMGWNQLQLKPGSRLFQGINSGPFVYFAHSYYLPAENGSSQDREAALADYGFQFVAAVEKKNIQGTQFHPEKSGEIGLRMLRNFAESC